MITGKILLWLTVILFIVALFLSWHLYQQARNKERMILIERGEKWADIFEIQKRNKYQFIFPYLKVGIVVTAMSFAFLTIAFIVLKFDNDKELFKGLLITFVLGFFFGVSLLINHFIGKKDK